MTASATKQILTIGMATYKDPRGVWLTLQALESFHRSCWADLRLMVLDNAPESCAKTKSATLAVRGEYLHRPDLSGTSAPRDALFRLARTPWVAVCDDHVIWQPGSVEVLLEYARKHPDSPDLVSGPLVMDDGLGLMTHWRPDRPPILTGVWDVAWHRESDGVYFTIGDFSDGKPTFLDLAGRTVNVDLSRLRPGMDLGEVLERQGCRRVGSVPFEIPMQGLGLFAMRRVAWPGFNRLFRGFGGEEGYVHEKVRRQGGKCLCLPGLRWKHWFRDGTPTPYRLTTEDHVWNLCVGHRELGIHVAAEDLGRMFQGQISQASVDAIAQAATKIQPLGAEIPRKRVRLLGVWYSNNAAPPKLLADSLATIQAAVRQTMHHDVMVATSSWHPIPNNPFPCVLGHPQAEGHLAIVQQIFAAINLAKAGGLEFDGIVFLEHDVLYPPNHFDVLGDGLATGARVCVNRTYEGLNETGWLAVKERHDPLHQMAMRWDVAQENLIRAKRDCLAQGWAYLEPDSAPGADRSDWYTIPPRGITAIRALMPAIHVNHPRRFTSHGEVCYESTSKGRLVHPFWGDFKNWWPLEAKPDVTPYQEPASGCTSCSGATLPPYASAEEWFEKAKTTPSDFHEHVETLRRLAGKCDVVVELSHWLKPSLIALAMASPRQLRSYCPGVKPDWALLTKLLPSLEFLPFQQDSLDVQDVPESDLLFVDTKHQCNRLYKELCVWAPKCRKYVVVHCTETFGKAGDDGQSHGVMPAIVRFLKENQEWTAIEQYVHNHGLIVLSRLDEDKTRPPSYWVKALNFAKARLKHLKSGDKEVSEAIWNERLERCLVCPHRFAKECGLCGCPVDEKTSWASESCPDKPQRWGVVDTSLS